MPVFELFSATLNAADANSKKKSQFFSYLISFWQLNHLK